MRLICILSFLAFYMGNGIAQIIGSYSGEANGDVLHLEITATQPKVVGTMKDSGQSYILDGVISGSVFKGTAYEASLGVTLELEGKIKINAIEMNGYINLFGTRQHTFFTTFFKINQSPQEIKNPNHGTSLLPNLLDGKSIDNRLIGTWRRENHYNSGYGDQAFSGSNYEYMQFNADHTMSDRGSSANMSGFNYSGNSGGMHQGIVIPNLWYYTSGNKIIAVIYQNGNYSTAELGTYFIENGNLLFTQVNTGQKILYSKM